VEQNLILRLEKSIYGVFFAIILGKNRKKHKFNKASRIF
jgi:hypothetical protein